MKIGLNTDPIKLFWTWWMKEKLNEHQQTKTEKMAGHMLSSEFFCIQTQKAEWKVQELMGDSATMIDRMTSNDVEYDYIIKRGAYDRENWCHWRPGPA